MADQSIAFSVPGSPNLLETLWPTRVGPADPCVKIVRGEVWRATRTPLGPATERLRQATDGSVLVEAWGDGAAWLIERAPVLCGRLDEVDSFQPTQEPVRTLWRRSRGLRICRTEAVFETAIATTIEQRVATHDAWQSWRGLIFSLGERAPGPMPGLWVPPAPERIARLPYEVFHRFDIERRRADILRRLAVVARRLEEMVTLPLELAYRRLMSLPGVGVWTSARIGLLALGDPDAVVLGDLHLPHMVTWALAGERRGSDERMLELLEPFRGHRGRVMRLLMVNAIGPLRALHHPSRLPP